MSDYLTDRAAEIAKAMKPREINAKQRTGHYDIVPYQTTHNTGGAIMGADPKTSVVNSYLQSWDVPNLFVIGATAFPQNRRLQPDRHGRRAHLLRRRRDQDAVPEESRAAGAGVRRKRCASARSLPALVAVATPLSRVAGAARPTPPFAEVAARPHSRRSPAIASPATPRQAASHSPAAGRSRRRSAPSTRPTSRPTATPASAPGADEDFYRAHARGRRGRTARISIPPFPIPISPR